VVIDMTEGFRQAVQVCCPRAAIVAEKFHVPTHVRNALRRVCFQVQPQSAREDVAFVRKRPLFSTNPTDLRMLAKRPQLATAWECVQLFRRIYCADSQAAAAEALEECWDRPAERGSACLPWPTAPPQPPTRGHSRYCVMHGGITR